MRGTPVHYDKEGLPVSPRFVPDAPEPDSVPDYMGYLPCIANYLVSCACRSEIFFHLRWGYYDDEPAEDDGLTLCERKRTQDKPGFWMDVPGHCADCTKVMKEAADDIGEDLGWIDGAERSP